MPQAILHSKVRRRWKKLHDTSILIKTLRKIVETKGIQRRALQRHGEKTCMFERFIGQLGHIILEWKENIVEF